MTQQELSVIQKVYDLIQWYVPILNRLPRDQKFALGDRIVAGLYDLLEGLILARYAKSNHESLGRDEKLSTKPHEATRSRNQDISCYFVCVRG